MSKRGLSLYNEILLYLETELAYTKANKKYPHFHGNGRDTAYYVLSNTIGHIKSMKANRVDRKEEGK